jgi:sugar phosphate isomerase/epimerase
VRFKISAGLWCLGSFPERYVPLGYFDELSLEQQLEIMGSIDGLDGLGIIYPTDPLPADPGSLVKKLAEFNLKVADISIDNYSHRRWKNGSFCTNEEKIRKENLALCKEGIDFAANIPGSKVMLWPAHDGFDYPFQVDYTQGWKTLVESYKEICNYNRDVTISLEYKQKDPRQRQYISNMGKMMMLINDVGMDNFTGCIDTGHSLMSQESLAETVMLLHLHDKLGIVHLNDNYRDSDPDLIFGTVAFWENLEMYYYLKKIGYDGWHEIDIVSSRDDRAKSMKLVVKLARKYEELSEKLLCHSETIDKNLCGYCFADNMDLISNIIF